MTTQPSEDLETLAYRYGTDKSHDDHKYSDLYAMLFDPIRSTTVNMTEIGVSSGQSIQVWHEYFHSATIWGVDIYIPPATRKLLAPLQRLRLLRMGSQNALKLSRLGRQLNDGSMDVIVDDGDHYPATQAETLKLWWPFLRAGGYYVIEDVTTGANIRNQMRYWGARDAAGYSQLAHNQSFWDGGVRRILYEHDSFLADTLVGHRAFPAFQRQARTYTHDAVSHNSHVLVIRKRAAPRTRAVDVKVGRVAMNAARTTPSSRVS